MAITVLKLKHRNNLTNSNYIHEYSYFFYPFYQVLKVNVKSLITGNLTKH